VRTRVISGLTVCRGLLADLSDSESLCACFDFVPASVVHEARSEFRGFERIILQGVLMKATLFGKTTQGLAFKLVSVLMGKTVIRESWKSSSAHRRRAVEFPNVSVFNLTLLGCTQFI